MPKESLPKYSSYDEERKRAVEIYYSKELVDFDEFTKNYNNFYLQFCGFGGYENKSIYYQKFKSENPDLEKYLSESMDVLVKRRDKTRGELLKKINPKLYEAYKIMMTYEEVKENWDLFK